MSDKPLHAAVAGGTLFGNHCLQTPGLLSGISQINQGTVKMQIPGHHPTDMNLRIWVWPRNLNFEKLGPMIFTAQILRTA